MSNNRKSLRLNYRAGINITFSTGEKMSAYTRDMSDGGLMVECQNAPAIKQGDLAEIIVLGIEGAVARPVKIIHIGSGGVIGVEFIIA